MPTNTYFSPKVRTEQHMYEDIIIESIRMYGQDVYYLPRTMISRDLIFGEDDGSRFDDAYMVEMYIENIEGFDGEGNLFTKFGLEIRDEATFVVARRSWQKYVGDNESEVRPKEGDLIYLPLSNSFFEISFVEHEQPFYQVSNLPVFKLSCRLFEYNGEEFDSGIGAIDSLEGENAYQYTIQVTALTQLITVGETLQQTMLNGATLTGQVFEATKVSDTEQIINVGTLASDDGEWYEFSIGTITTDGGATGNIVTVSDPMDFVVDESAENDTIEQTAVDFIDFSESNPFGEV